MKKLIYIVIALSVIITACETEDNYIDTGISNGRFDGNMMEYFASNSYDWDSTALVIQRAGIEDIFNGTNDAYPEITFLGPTNHSIRRWMINEGYDKVADIPADLCKTMMLKHIVKGKFMKEDIDYINTDYTAANPDQDGGTVLTCLGGNKVLAYKQREDYGGVSEGGAIVLRFYSLDAKQKVPMASADIEPDNGVVHSLNYTYTFGGI